jgi:hypothetical protein
MLDRRLRLGGQAFEIGMNPDAPGSVWALVQRASTTRAAPAIGANDVPITTIRISILLCRSMARSIRHPNGEARRRVLVGVGVDLSGTLLACASCDRGTDCA